MQRGRASSRRPDDPALPRVRLTLLDGFACHHDDVAIELPPSTQRLLAYLALQPGRATRSGTAGALWPDVAEYQARGTLRSTMWRLSRLGPDLVVVASDHILLSPATQVDAWEQWAHAQTLLKAAPTMTEAELDGPSLGGWLLPGWSDDWTIIARERLHQAQLHGLEALACRLLALGRHGAAVQAALQAIQLDPLRESSYRVLTRIHLEEGNIVEALRCHATFRHLVRTELAVSPSQRFEALIEPYRSRGPAPPAGRTRSPQRQIGRRWA